MIIRLSVKKSSSEKNKQVKHPDDVELKCVFFLFSIEKRVLAIATGEYIIKNYEELINTLDILIKKPSKITSKIKYTYLDKRLTLMNFVFLLKDLKNEEGVIDYSGSFDHKKILRKKFKKIMHHEMFEKNDLGWIEIKINSKGYTL